MGPRNSPADPMVVAPAPSAMAADAGGLSHRIDLSPPRGRRDPTALLDREWLLTNGTGAFAMGTVPAVNARRYHGLLVAAARPPLGRVVALNQMLEQLVVSAGAADTPLDFSALLFRDVHQRLILSPAPGPTTLPLVRFEKGLGVRWAYQTAEVQVTRELHLHWKEQAATLRYRIALDPEYAFFNLAGGAAPPAAPKGMGRTGKAASAVVAPTTPKLLLRLWPMLTLRDFHSLLRKDGAGRFEVAAGAAAEGRVMVRRTGAQPGADGAVVTLSCRGAKFIPHDQWWYDIYYHADHERGQGDREDHFLPGYFEVELAAPTPARREQEVVVTVALGDQPAEPCDPLDAARMHHLAPIVRHLEPLGAGGAGNGPNLARLLALASDDFVVERTVRGRKLATIIAGYPWFADWGRDTFIALPGLLLETGRFDDAQAVLHAFAQSIQDGLVPNRFDDYDDAAAHYNTVDASLWYVRAAMEYLRVTQDQASWDQWLCAACTSILDNYIRGTRFGIRMAGDGLITAGHEGTQLTWMDAACGGVVFTPRQGKAVEINALWYHALVGVTELIGGSPDPEHQRRAAHYTKLADRIRRSFVKVFWDEVRNCLCDHVWTDEANQEHRATALRPNQIWAAALPRSPLPRTKQQQVLEVVRQHLLTPVGLRTLAPGDPKYHREHRGDMFQRDEAYHQGMVWPWLIGAYAEAILRVNDFSPAARQEALAAVTPLMERLGGEGLGQLHEIHEPEAPYRAVGAVAQAWSVAELIRALKLIKG